MEQLRHPYDELRPVKIFFFFALVWMFDLIFLATAYPFGRARPLSTDVATELAMAQRFWGDDLFLQIVIRGDAAYDALFVRSGVQSWVYDYFRLDETFPAGPTMADIPHLGMFLRNLFDYLLLMSRRVSAVLVLLAGGCFFVLALFGDVMLRRKQRRYSFGDIPVLYNIWMRHVVSYALPLSIIVLHLPMALPPLALVAAVLAMSLSLSVFLLTVPKFW